MLCFCKFVFGSFPGCFFFGDDYSVFVIIYCVGLNKDFKKMLSEHAEFRALSLKDILTSSDGTRKVEIIFFIYSKLVRNNL